MMIANPVNPAAARQAAARFLQEKGAELKNQAMQAPRRAMGQMADGQDAQEASPYYVFNATGKHGFVIVSGDDCVGDNLVLGYADQGSFDAGNVPANMQEWLDGMASQIAAMSRRGVKARAIALHDDVAPLLTCTWGQGKPAFNPQSPYNALCPVVDGLLSCTGCMATALSQVLYYHRWPQEPIVGELPGYKTYTTQVDIEPLPSVQFDWDNMLDSYQQETTETQRLAVATLMRYCGQVLQMDYTPSISNAYVYDTDVLIRQFGIDQGVHLAHADEYSINEWDSLLYTELKEKRPLLHGGFSMGGGHAFVLDGYEVHDGVGYFHANWGWDGSSNGFYRIDVLNPYASGTGGSSTSDGFCVRQNTLIGFQPAKSALENYGRYLVSISWNVYYNDEPHYFFVLNTSHMPVNYTIAMAERLADGTIDYNHILGEQSMEIEGYSYAGLQETGRALRFFKMFDHVADGLAPGSHRFVFVNKEVGTDAPWHPIFGPNCSVEIKVGDDGQPTDTIIHPQPQLTSDAVKVEGLGGLSSMMMWGIKQTVSATIANKSDDAFTGSVFCSLYYVDNDTLAGAVRIYETALFIEANGKTDVNIDIYPPSPGNYVAVITDSDVNMTGIKLADIKNVKGYIGQKNVTAKELTFYIHNIAYEVTTPEDGEPNAHFNLTLGNYTPMDYESTLLAKVYKLDSDNIWQPVYFSGGSVYQYAWVKIGSNQRTDACIGLDQVLEPGDYGVEFMIASDFYGLKFSDFFSFASYTFKVEDVTDIKVIDGDQSTNADTWFTLDGRKLDSRPTAKGVYIRSTSGRLQGKSSGHKVIIK